ncbi:chromosome partitioning protein [Desulfovibrio litoralis DSM 11393]|uniref:Chromosome partitioning protein n=1 Tax=Desulfovibrio litoralis DSM 11393 TaxID=1121455 RepID=A0A1M7RSK9_9BACT|nr:chromosome partitioning protein [Desulfovibrio litoralis DSM 11393]
MAKIIAIANQKGGVGKTTTTITLSAALAKNGYRVLVVDLDPHACASVHLRFYPDESSFSVNDIFADEAHDLDYLWENIRQHHYYGFDIVPANIRLAELEVDLRSRKGKGGILQNALNHVSKEYDFILLDCPPHVGILLVNALVASDLVIIPIQTDFLALHGLKLLFDTLRILNKVLPNPIVYRALPTMFDRRARACHRVIELLTQKLGDRMFSTVIGIDTRFRDASAKGQVIFEIAPDSRGAREYNELAEEMLRL